MLSTCIQTFPISKSCGIGIANFGFWTADDDYNDEIFFEDPNIQELTLHTKVETVGDFTVTIQEKSPDRKKVASLITFHDIGLNHSSFKEFFHHEDNLQLWDKFKIYHIDAPGQQQGAEKFSSQYQFPSLPQIAKMLVTVLEHFNITKDIIGFGVGAGANILLYLAMERPEWITGLVLVDPAGKSAGFREWGEEKLASWQLETKGFTSASEKFLIWHHFGNKAKKVNMEKVDQYIKEVANNQNPHNMAQFVRAYMNRTDMYADIAKKLSCHVLILTSDHSPYKEEANRLFSVLPKQKANIMEALDTVNVFFEDPSRCGEGMLLLMQGCHLVPTLRTRTASKSGPVRAPSMSEDY